MRIISAPINRALLYLHNKSIAEDDILLSNIQSSHHRTTDYPFKIKLRHKIIFRLKMLLDYDKRVKYSKSYKKESIAWNLSSIIISNFPEVIEKLIIFFFRDSDCDRQISPSDSVMIFGFFSMSELFLYSSAHRKKKKITFSLCRWDDYVHCYIPKHCDQYESWGTEFTKSLLKDIPDASVLKNRIPFKVYDKKSSDKIIVYEGTFSIVSKDQQKRLLKHLLDMRTEGHFDIVFKKLFKTTQFNDKELIELGIIPFNTSQDFSDHGSTFNGSDDLSELVPIAKHVICFNISHAILEYGINSIPYTCIITNSEMYTFPLAIRLRECGSDFIAIEELHKLDYDYFFNKKHPLSLTPFLEHQ
jgi:hypothetical protein